MLIRPENTEYISRNIGDRYSGIPLFEKLKSMGVSEDVVIYPNTKWRMVYDVMNHYSNLPDTQKALEMLSKIIDLSVHPLNCGADMELSEKLISDFNKRLGFDKLALVKEKDGSCLLTEIFTVIIPPEEKSLTDYIVEAVNYFKDEYNKVKLNGLTYKYMLGQNKQELLFTYDIEDVIESLHRTENRARAIEELHKIGFVKEYKIETLSKNNVYDIGTDYAFCVIDESKLTEKQEPATDFGVESVIQKVVHEHTHTFENSIQEKEIILNIKNSEENIVRKNNGKRVTLQKFPRTEWAKVSITFLDETNILLSDGNSTKPSDFEGLGCEDSRNGKTDENWNFLLKLAMNDGQTLPITKAERTKQKKQKQKITDILRKIFQNDTDPFETEMGGVYKAKFTIKYNIVKKEKVESKYADLADVFSEMTHPIQEDESSDGDFSQ